MRLATFSTQEPPRPIDCVETKEYISSMRRRIEVQTDLMESLADQVLQLRKQNAHLEDEVEKLSLDLGIRQGDGGQGWTEAGR